MAIQVNDSTDAFDKIPLDKEEGSEFGWFDRLLFGWRDGKVFDYGDWEARDIFEMLAKDYRARQLENVLVQPILAAERNIVAADGDKGDAEWLSNYWKLDHLNGGCKTSLDEIVELSTSAISYKRAFFEKVWTRGSGDFSDSLVYDKLGWRPQTTCRIRRDPKNGTFAGFEQEAYYVGPQIAQGHWPIEIPAKRAFVHLHNRRRDPLSGSSDMEIAYWCWKTKQKVLFLWFQFLENVSLPRLIVSGPDQGTANAMAAQVAKLKGSGVLPVVGGTGTRASGHSLDVTALDVSGKGAEQFMQAVQWLDNAAVDAVNAGFINLTGGTGNQGQAGGSYALSKDASDFFLQSEESKVRELSHSIRRHVFAPLIRANRGPSASVPHLKFEPLNDEDKSSSVQLFQSLLAQPQAPGQESPVPAEFIHELAKQVADYIGLDGTKVYKSFQKAAEEAQAAAKANPNPAASSPAGQQVAGVMGATQAAQNVVDRMTKPQGPKRQQTPQDYPEVPK